MSSQTPESDGAQRPGVESGEVESGGANTEAYAAAMGLVGASASTRLVGTAAALGAGFFTTVLAVRTFGIALYGIVAFGLSAVDLFAVLVTLGLRTGTVRAAAVLSAEDDRDGMAQLVRSVFTLLALLGAIGAMAVFALSLSRKGAPLSARLLLALGLAMLLLARNAAGALSALALGLRRVVWMEIPNLVLVLVQFIVVLALWLSANKSIAILGAGFVLGALIVLAVSAYELRALLPNDQRRLQLAPRAAARFLAGVGSYAVAGVAVEAIADFDVITLGVARSSHEVGTYQPALRVIDILTIPLGLLYAGFVPGAIALFHKGDSVSFSKLYLTVSKLAYVATFPLVILLAAFPDAIMHLIFGPQFPIRYDVVWVLLIGYGANLAFGLNGAALVATGRRRLIGIAYLATLITMVILALVLIPLFGSLGAACATSSSYVVMNVAVTWALYRAAGVHVFRRDMILVVGTSLFPLAGAVTINQGLPGWPVPWRIGVALALSLCWVWLLIAARLVPWADVVRLIPGRTAPPA